MPVAHFHLPADTFDPEQERALLLEAGRVYARVLDSPVDRVRVFLVHYPRALVAVAGQIIDEGGAVAPYFTAIVLAGRPEAQRAELLQALTDCATECLAVDRSAVRGQIIEVDPANWGIGGTTASSVRAAEITARTRRMP